MDFHIFIAVVERCEVVSYEIRRTFSSFGCLDFFRNFCPNSVSIFDELESTKAFDYGDYEVEDDLLMPSRKH